MNFENIYKGKKVFLTGHTGFKGSWMVATLHLLGAKVKGFALDPENDKDLYNLIDGDSLCDSIIGDIRDSELLRKAILDFQPDFIFHLAAQPLVRLSYETPIETFDINAIGTANVLDAIRFLNKPCSIVLITTDKVYENKEWLYPYRENDVLGGYDPYSASKACAEVIISSYRNSFFNLKDYSNHQKSIAVGRAGNVIGGGDWSKDRIIPDIIRALSNNQEIIIRNPNAVRPWQHVLEPISGYLILGAKLSVNPVKHSQAYNFGPNIEDNLNVRELTEIAIEIWGSGKYVVPNLENQLHEAGLLRLDISKAMTELDWKPQLNSKIATKMTIDWYKSIYNYKKKTFSQIENYYSL
jgi:CDP-glucose 4,6-dehydratase